ncbi:unnamed protein product [Oikopleura dioica]|uniref:Acyltransferase 3 domain-containing protein n=1 Tax=Oikopleura dioica TaxID=34765 RepID=E4XCF2_OIKDI|nr:unnamed protein product [Oikopleura dioica]
MGLLGRYGIGARVHWRSDKLVKQCEDWWWRNILYVTNLIKNCDEKGDCRVNSCLGHSWYLSNDMQFFVFGVPLIFVLSKFPKVGLGVWISVLLANISYLVSQFHDFVVF